MKKQIRYHSEEQILKRIDRYQVKHKLAMAERAVLVQQIDERLSERTCSEHWLNCRKEDIGRCHRKLDRIERILHRLKDKLAEFRTPLLIPGDGSVAA